MNVFQSTGAHIDEQCNLNVTHEHGITRAGVLDRLAKQSTPVLALTAVNLVSSTRIPSGSDGDLSEIKHADNLCMDTLGHSSGETIGTYRCHGSGGNQVKTWPAACNETVIST